MSTKKSPRLTKADAGKLSKRQQNKFQKALDSVTNAAGEADGIKAKREAHREHINALNADLADIDDSLSKHPLVVKRGAKKQEISIAKAELQEIVQELADAKARLESKLQSKHAVASALKQELQDDDDDDA